MLSVPLSVFFVELTIDLFLTHQLYIEEGNNEGFSFTFKRKLKPNPVYAI